MARRALCRLAVVLLAVGCASAERTLSQFGKGVDVQGAINSAHATVEGLKNKQPVIPAPLSVVQGANYVRPAMAVSNKPVFVAPLAVEGPRFRLPTLPTLPARVPAPAPVPFVSPVMQGAIYASGPALPSYAPLVVPKKKWFPFLTKVVTLGITAVHTPDPVVVPQPAMPLSLGKGAAVPAQLGTAVGSHVGGVVGAARGVFGGLFPGASPAPGNGGNGGDVDGPVPAAAPAPQPQTVQYTSVQQQQAIAPVAPTYG